MFLEERRDSRFQWSHLGDVQLGRPNLGNTTSVEVYRLMQYTLRDAAIKYTDPATAARIFYDAGYNSGKAVFENLIAPVSTMDELIAKLQSALKTHNVGILRLEFVDIDGNAMTLTVAEDLDCSGLPEQDEAICTYDEGFIAGILDTFSGKKFNVKEIDCWCTGDRVCRFRAESI